MIITKPYAFLIKHFKKIHILLFALCCYVYYKNMQLSSFVKEFINLGTYDVYNEPITKYASNLSILFMILIIVGSITLIILLRHKGKPWKLYLLPIIEYTVMLFVFFAARNYFANYVGGADTTTIRAVRDFVLITTIFEFPVFAVFLIRILGVDLHKFNFNKDEEYLELDSKDKEELEINIDIDKESIKRNFKRLLRNLNYFYQEHKFICNVVIGIIAVIVIKNTYTYIFVTNKSYTQGDSLEANGYTITVNNSYFTDKDYKGDKISKESNFVILDLTIKNNSQKRKIDLNKFHIMNGINNYTTTAKTYETEFQDFGKTYEEKELTRDETFNLIMVFKVDKDLRSNKFVLYYQEFIGNTPHLRKIKLKINDVSEIKENESLNIGEKLKFTINSTKQTIILKNADIEDNVDYTFLSCYTDNTCDTETKNYIAPAGYKLINIEFSSDNYDGKDMIDFSTKYGKISYIDSKGKTKVTEVKNAISRKYNGKNLYLKITDEVANSKSIKLIFTVRNNKYTYVLK